MPYPFRRGRTVTVTRYTVNERTQQRVADPDFTGGTITRCAYDPGSTRENEEGDSVTQSPRFFGPYDIDIEPGDTVAVAGVEGVFEVDGEVLRWRNDLTGRTPCAEVKLRRKAGALR